MSPVCFSSSSTSVITSYPEDFTDISAEAAVLGSLILDNDKEYIGPVRAILRDAFYFFKPEHQHIYNAICSLDDKGSRIDLLLLKSELVKQNILAAVGGVDNLVLIAESTPTKHNVMLYTEQVLDKYKQRRRWDHSQNQLALLRSGGGWNQIETSLRQAERDYAESQPAGGKAPALINCGNIQTTEIAWLWPNRIPSGMFNLLVGDPGIGKSFLTCYMSAVISTGGNWPDGTAAPSGSVFLFCDEDDFSKVVVPRLMSNGANTSKVFCANMLAGDNVLFNIADPEHLQILKESIQHTGDVRLIIFDPITSYLGKVNANSNAEVRAALAGLVRLAQETGVCMLGISHLNKKSDLDAMYRSLGSMGFVAQARSVWAVIKDKDDTTGETKIFSPIKSNLSIKVKGLSYQIQDARLVWGTEPVEESIDQSLRESPAMDEATDFLLEVLSRPGKLVERNNIETMAAERDITKAAIKRAKKKLGIKSVFVGKPGEGRWFWKIQEKDSNVVPA
jgi:putative DNA primase/helicase